MSRIRIELDTAEVIRLCELGRHTKRRDRAQSHLTREAIARRFGVSTSVVTQIANGYRRDDKYFGKCVAYNKRDTPELAALAKSPTCEECGRTKEFDADVNGFPFEWCGNTRCRLGRTTPPVRDFLTEQRKHAEALACES